MHILSTADIDLRHRCASPTAPQTDLYHYFRWTAVGAISAISLWLLTFASVPMMIGLAGAVVTIATLLLAMCIWVQNNVY